MKVNFPKEDTGFQIHPHQFCGLDSFLVIPKINAVWTTENLFFRSLIIDKSGEVLSSGWPKFFNNGEKPELYPDLHNYQDWHIHEKLDGSLLIADYVNGEFSMRTRGCSSYKQQSNFKDFELLHEKYPKIVDFLKENSHISLLCEIITPNNIIVIRTNDVQFYLLGAINKITLQVVSHQELLEIWKKVGCMPTPKSYQIDGIKDISTLANLVKQWKGSEGVVVSYNGNQHRVKIKSDWYLFCHKIKSQFSTLENLIDFYVETNMLDYDALYKKIETEFDFEIALQVKDDLFKISVAGEKAKHYIDNILEFVHDIRNFPSRKEQAETIKTNYGTNASYAFNVLDNKSLTNTQWKKLVLQKIE